MILRCVMMAATWWSLTISVASSAFAAPESPATDGPTTWPIAPIVIIGIRSLDAVAAAAKRLGVPLPPRLTADGIEKEFTFVGAGGLAVTKPFGVIVTTGTNLAMEDGVVFVLPMQPHAASLDTLRQLGGKLVPGHADTVVLNGIGLRRTASYLLLGPREDAVVAVSERQLSGDFKQPNTLARLTLDIKSARAVTTKQFNAFMNEIVEKERVRAGPDASRRAGSALGIRGLKSAFETLDRIDLSIDSIATGWRTVLAIKPVDFGSPTPGAVENSLPAGIVGRLDFAFPPRSIVSDAAMDGLVNLVVAGGAVPEQKPDFLQMMREARDLMIGGDSASIGVTMTPEGKPVVFVVETRAKFDYASAVRRWVDHVRAIDAKWKAAPSIELELYGTGGATVSRVRLLSNGKTDKYIDGLSQDNKVFMTFSPADSHEVTKLLAGQRETTVIPGVFSASVNLQKAFQMIQAIPESGAAELPDARRKQITDLLAAQTISLSAKKEGPAGVIDLALTNECLDRLIKVFGSLMEE